MIKSAQEAKKQSLFNLDLNNKVDKNLLDIEKKIDSAIRKGETYIVLDNDSYNVPSWFLNDVLKSILNSDSVEYLTLMALKGLGYRCNRIVGSKKESSAFGDCDVQTVQIRVSWS